MFVDSLIEIEACNFFVHLKQSTQFKESFGFKYTRLIPKEISVLIPAPLIQPVLICLHVRVGTSNELSHEPSKI